MTMSAPDPLYVLGAGMHPWGKWGRDFTEYGVVAARAALAEAGLDWRQIQLVAGADTIRNGYPGFIAGSTFAQKLGWNGVPVSSSYAACASGSQALQSARAHILAGFCDVALVIGADTTPKGAFAPVGGERKNDPDWQRFHLIGAMNPVYFALLARRRMDLYGATSEDFAQVKVKNSQHGLQNPNARYRKESSVEDVLASPVVSDPLRQLDICATSDGAAALIVASADFTRKHLGSLDGVPSVRAVSTVTPQYPQHLPELPDIATDSTAVAAAPDRVFKDQILDAAYAEAGIGPEDVSLAEVYDLSTALELDWYEHLGLCAEGRSGGAAAQRRDRHRRQGAGQRLGRAGLLRRGDPGAGDCPGLRVDLAAARSGHRPSGRGRQSRRHREPGPVRPRLVGHRRALTLDASFEVSRVSRTTSATCFIVVRRSIAARWIHLNASGSVMPWLACSSPLARSTSLRVSSRSPSVSTSRSSARTSLNRLSATSIAGIRSEIVNGFTKYAIAPASRAFSTRSRWLNAVSTTIGAMRLLAISDAASMPSRRGIFTSMITRSGLSFSASSTASWPSPASPTIS